MRTITRMFSSNLKFVRLITKSKLLAMSEEPILATTSLENARLDEPTARDLVNNF